MNNQSNDPSIVKEIKCIKNVHSSSACLNKNCNQHAFTCSNQSCDCRKQHKSCFMIETSTILKNFSQKRISASILSKTINQQFKKLYQQISKFKNKMLKDIQTQYGLFGLNDDEKLLFKSLKTGETASITGSQIWKTCIIQKEETRDNLDQLISRITGNLTRYQKAANGFFEKLLTFIKDYDYKQVNIPVKHESRMKVQNKEEKTNKTENDQQQTDRRKTRKNRNDNFQHQNKPYNRNENDRYKDQRRQTKQSYKRQDRREYRRQDRREENKQDKIYDRRQYKRDEREYDRRYDRREERKQDRRQVRRQDRREEKRQNRRNDVPQQDERRRRYND